jgi:Na+/melibiose symporter-like transporter
LIGYLSDNTKTSFGPRKPWILSGYALTLIAAFALFAPPEGISITYFAIWFVRFYRFLTMAEIPFAAWQMELSRDYDQRSRIATYRMVFSLIGSLCFAAVPLLPVFPTSEFTPQTLQYVAWGLVILLPPLVLIATVFVPQGKNVAVTESTSLVDLYRSVRQNRPFLHLFLCFLIIGIAGGVFMGAEFMFVDTYLGAGDKYPFLMITAAVVSILAMPFWLKIIKRFGKHRTWAISTVVGAIAILFQIFLEPGTEVFIPLLLIFSTVTAVFACSVVASMAMLGDTIDYDVLKTGVNRSGQYFSFLALIMKANAAIGGGAAFYLLSLFDYDPQAVVHDDWSAFGMKLTCIFIPPVFYLLGAVLIWFFPINRRRQEIIKKRIESRAERMQRDAA